MNYVDRMVERHERDIGRALRDFERSYLWEFHRYGPWEFFGAAFPLESWGRYAFQISRRAMVGKPAYWTLNLFCVRVMPWPGVRNWIRGGWRV